MPYLCETLTHKDLADIILKNGYFRVCDNIAGVHLHEVRLYKEAGFAAAGTAHHKHIFVSGV